MKREEVQEIFLKILRDEEDVSAGVAAIKTLLTVIENYKVTTVRELDLNLQCAVEAMRNCDQPVAAISSGCELFMRFITFAKLDVKSFEECERIMLERGRIFLDRLLEARGKVAKIAITFIPDGCKILTHSRSRVVKQALLEAVKANKRFQVFVTMSSPDNSGVRMHKELEEAGIDATLILDSSVGYIMEQIDLVMVGAEGVTESGGIINKIGTFTVAMAAREHKTPLLVVAESFKFSRIYPLNQRDIPNDFKYLSSTLKSGDLSKQHPLVDYTPPLYVSLLSTDLGVMPASAIGTFTVAMAAKEHKKQLLVVAESFKFSRIYPLNQRDIPNDFKYISSVLESRDLLKQHPLVDYTPPMYITLLSTDLGLMPPSAVSDELIKLYL